MNITQWSVQGIFNGPQAGQIILIMAKEKVLEQ
jgi:hypothetical protein